MDIKEYLINKKIGGKKIGEGGYGCTFIPLLKCKDKPEYISHQSNDLSVSKLIVSKYANIEFSVSKQISKIPLWKNYFIVSESICTPSKQTDKDVENCDVLDMKYIESNYKILNMPYGGISLYKSTFDLHSFDFMKFVKHFIEAGALLNLFGIVHRDLHDENILVDKYNVPRIIDYNFAIFIEQNITSANLRHDYTYHNPQECPDSTLINAVNLGYKSYNVIDTIVNKKPIIQKIVSTLGISRQHMSQSLELFYSKNKDINASDNVEWFKNYWRTIDSWSIGINIVSLIVKMSLWPHFSETIRTHKHTLFPVLKKMCEVSPSERIDCVQALYHLEPNSFIIRKYATLWLEKVGNGNI